MFSESLRYKAIALSHKIFYSLLPVAAFLATSAPAIICHKHFISGRMCVCDHIPKVCEHDILETACENFTKLTSSVQLRNKMN